MTALLQIVAALLVAAGLMAALPVLVLCVQIVAARRGPLGVAPVEGPRLAVALLMPAHNESASIAAAVRAAMAQLAPGDRLLVVADNCSDDTAEIASRCGAEVTRREDPGRRGKGYALDHGVRQLALDPPSIVIVLDADCLMRAGAVAVLADECARSGRPAQALYLMHAGPGAGLGTRIAEFAWVVRNEVRPLGMARLRLPCQLMGTGMAFPWPLLSGASLASGSIVEDMQLGLDLAAAGAAPHFCHGACVTSRFPDNRDGATAQRTRWEHGHLTMIATRGLSLLATGVRRGDVRLIAMALDLCVPPIASLALFLAALAMASVLLLAFGGSAMPLVLSIGVLALMMLALISAWRRFARHVLSAGEMAGIPAYMLAKIPIYFRLLTARQTEWIRTRRDGGPK